MSPGSSLLRGGTLSLTSVSDSSEADRGTERTTAEVSKQTRAAAHNKHNTITYNQNRTALSLSHVHLENLATKLTLFGLNLVGGDGMSACGQRGGEQNVRGGCLVLGIGKAGFSAPAAQ